ncbi:hypothetical protein F5X71_00330 [Nocardia brasiliensis]|uniref:Uncharacterized protein n=1 Tax=Nocardia brasiliensis TaxID=37326 RepID=A0A6G9XJF5_NOCBR|nr:hypothetical protein F5X71_00330 [Nocardia brasiliensis]
MEFIEARLAELEGDAERARSKAAGPGGDGVLWVVTGMDNAVGVFYDPARELRTVAAIRTLITGHEPTRFGDEQVDSCAVCSHDIADGFHFEPWPCGPVRTVASIWSDHPDYREVRAATP